MKVCIAEKPSVAREIAYIVGANDKRDGFFEGNGYCVTWTFGHFCGLKEPHDYQADWKKWNLGTLPILPAKFETKLKNDKGIKKQFGIVKNLFKKASVVINCGDAGQEGELIQRWVIQQAKYKGKVQRLWISSLTAEAIREGFKNLKDAEDYNNLFYAGSSRAIGDWLLGMNATRLYTLKYGGYKQVLSIGRVQTPTLAMVVKRHKEIINFKPEPFWELHTTYRDTNFTYEKGRFQKKEDGEALLKKVQEQPFTIDEIKAREGVEYPPRLFDLTSLQVYCNQRFSYSADQTLKIVQKLYEKKVVTYPRVDTTYLPNDQYPKCSGILQKMTNYSSLTQPLLGKKLPKPNKVFNDKKVTDHHAIIPTGFQKNLDSREQNVYDIIARRFIGAFYPNCKVKHVTVTGNSAGVKFKARGKEILEEGWRVVFQQPTNPNTTAKSKKNTDEKILPTFVKGETGPHEPKLLEKMTQPPKYYTEATLLRAMETAGKQVDDDELRDLMKENGIGRPSTRASIIQILLSPKRRYIYKQKKSLIPTEAGVQLIDIIQNDLLKSPEMTGQWEKKIREIEQGNYGAGQFVWEMKTMIGNLVEEVKKEQNAIKISNQKYSGQKGKSNFKKSNERNSKGKGVQSKKRGEISQNSKLKTSDLTQLFCPKCRKGKMLKGKTAYGCSEYKTGCAFRLPFRFMDKKISEKQLARLMKLGSTINLKGFKQNGEKVDGKVHFDGEYNLTFTAKVKREIKSPDVVPCPKCKVGRVVKGKNAYGCSDWKSGCDFRFSFEELFKKADGRKLTKFLVYEILLGK